MNRTTNLYYLDQYQQKFHDAYMNISDDGKAGCIEKEYLAMSQFFQQALITSDYIIDTGNYRTVNLVFIESLLRKIDRHPFLWSIVRFIFGV